MKLRKRPVPQKRIDKKYIKNGSNNNTMMVLADPIYLGHAPSISMKIKDLIPLQDEDEQAADEFASEIIAKHMKEICKNWKLLVTDEPFANKDAEIENYAEKYNCEYKRISIREKNSHKKTSSLTVFMNAWPKIPGPIMRRIEAIIDGCIASNKPVCVIDSFGVKRYPRR